MTEPSPGLDDALDRIAALEAHCRKLRQVGGDKIQPGVAQLEELLSEIRSNLRSFARGSTATD